jgi:alpha-1,2-mannosyltransferase
MIISDDSTPDGGSRRFLPVIKRRLRTLPKAVRLAALIAPILLLVSAYYLWVWESVAAFVAAVDANNLLFEDFTAHYYPTGRTILHTSTPISGYFYSAFFALLLVPLGLLEPMPVMWCWGALQAVSLVALCALPLVRLMRLTPCGIALYTAVCATSFPLLHNTKWGQVSVPLAVCVLAAFHAYAGKKRILAGVILAVAAAIKYYPAAFLVYFILKRDFRVCVSFALALIALYVLLPAAVLGPRQWMAFEKAKAAGMSDADWIPDCVNSQYIAHVAERWSQLTFQKSVGRPGAQALTLIGYAIFLCNIALLWLMQRRNLRDEYTLSLVLLFLSLPFVIKTSWPHYFSYLPFCQVAVFAHLASARCPPNSWRKALILLPLSSIACSSVFVFNVFPNWEVYSVCGMLFISNLLLLVCVYPIALRRNPGKQSLPGDSRPEAAAAA